MSRSRPRLRATAAIVGLALLAGCAGDAPRRHFADTEAALDTDGGTTLHSHAASYYPRGVSLGFPGFVVAVDKSPRDAVLGGAPLYLHDVSHAGRGMAADAARLAGDAKLLYVSHVHEYTGRPYGDGNCYHYSVYERRGVPGPVPPCRDAVTAAGEPPFARGFDALGHLRDVLSERLRAPDPGRLRDASGGSDYTHLVVVVMGWNTTQVQAFRNFGSLMGHLHAAAGGDRAFRPLFVGVTWPSFWESDWLDPLWKLFSYPNKANDADELGLSWLGVLLRDVVGTLPREGLTTVVVGHSFGARAVATAACVGAAVDAAPTGSHRAPPPVDLLVGLQPAFSINRFLAEPAGVFDEDIHFPGACAPARRLVLTASAGDTAVDSQLIADMAGDEASWQRLCAPGAAGPFACAQTDADGGLDAVPDARLVYLDASTLIHENAHGTGGGAHSDIYRAATGRLLWRLVETLP